MVGGRLLRSPGVTSHLEIVYSKPGLPQICVVAVLT